PLRQLCAVYGTEATGSRGYAVPLQAQNGMQFGELAILTNQPQDRDFIIVLSLFLRLRNLCFVGEVRMFLPCR
ncbi:MAG: hypothetical protein LUG66_06055, partial [Clostridiales bacterium]|nr:hypothetical protein [Clostridiales bacterium]